MGTEEDSRETTPASGAGSRFLQEERAHRLAKLDALRERGIEPYPVRFDRDHTAAAIRERFADLGPGADRASGSPSPGASIACAATAASTSPTSATRPAKIQLIATRDDARRGRLHDLDALDLGDWVGVEGIVVTTRRGELSVRVESSQLLSRRCARCPTCATGSPTPRPATASATST